LIVPGGFGADGTEGKIRAIHYARVNKIPFLGICLGMQLAVIEFARNVLKLENAGSEEFGNYENNIVHLISDWYDSKGSRHEGSDRNLGGTMRLGSYPCRVRRDSLAYDIYKMDVIQERHRHRFEINMQYVNDLEKAGMLFSGVSDSIDGLPEICELDSNNEDKQWFIGVQYHPEFQSTPMAPHPIFLSLVSEAMNNKQ